MGKLDRAAAEKWVNAHLAQENKDIEELLAAKSPRTLENTLQPYDNAQNELTIALMELLISAAEAKSEQPGNGGEDESETHA